MQSRLDMVESIDAYLKLKLLDLQTADIKLFLQFQLDCVLDVVAFGGH